MGKVVDGVEFTVLYLSLGNLLSFSENFVYLFCSGWSSMAVPSALLLLF